MSDRHTLVVANPGHFHAALTLRQPHPRLDENVHVYAEDGPDLERFVAIVQAFNARPQTPTRWRLHVHRGPDWLTRLLAEQPGRLAVVAGRNDVKMNVIRRLHAAGFHVLADKPWVIDAEQLDALRAVCDSAPLAMDVMTERHEVSVRLMRVLMSDARLFGHARSLTLQSVHHLYKLVNGRPLVRPAWYFDTAVQGEGIGDVNTHLADLVQWMLATDIAYDYARDVELLDARQWSTAVPLECFRQVTGLDAFPEAVRVRVQGDTLQYLCNSWLRYTLRGVAVELEAIWGLAIPEGGGDTHCFVAHGAHADIEVRLDASTGFRTALTLRPRAPDAGYAAALERAIAGLQKRFPGIAVAQMAAEYCFDIPDRLRTTHEEHFAVVLDDFIACVDAGTWPRHVGADLVAKYTLLQQARTRSHAHRS